MKRKKLLFQGLFLLVVASISVQVCAIPPAYTYTHLGTLGGSSSLARAINDNGQVVGSSGTSDGTRAFLWNQGLMINLGSLNNDVSVATDINNSGQIVGYNSNSSLLWENYGLSLQSLDANGKNGVALALNESGKVAGYTTNGNSEPRAALWDNENYIDIGTVDGIHRAAYDINEAGQIVGEVIIASTNTIHASLWENGLLQDLGTLDNHPNSEARSINDLGQIAGVSQPQYAGVRGFFWENNTMTDIGHLGGESTNVWSINNSSQIVGSSKNSDQHTKAFIWEPGVGMVDLNTLVDSGDWELLEAWDINSSGQIVGLADWPDGPTGQQAFLLTPIPEPATLSFLAIGGLILQRKKRIL